jgi:hypothetical protein
MEQIARGETNRPVRLFSGVQPCSVTEATLTVHARDLRRSKRKRVLIRATLISTEGAQTVRLKDLTSDGAGIACEVPLSSGSDVILRRGDLFIAARVVWAEGLTAGLEFYRPLTGEWLEIVADPSQAILR